MNKIKRILSGVTALALSCGLAITASAELKTGDYRAYKGAGYMAKYEVLSVKDGKTTVKVTLKNTSKKTINNWAVRLGDYGKIESVKNGRQFTPDWYSIHVIKDDGTNGRVAPNQCVSFSYTISDPDNKNTISGSIKVYSDLDKSNSVKDLNKTAFACYNGIDQILNDYKAKGISLEECFKNGVFANLNSKDGMKTGFNYRYKSEVDREMNVVASMFARGNISLFVGRTEIDGEDTYFVQVKDNRTGKVGQYPRWTDGTAEWGIFDLDAPVYAVFSESQLDFAVKEALYSVIEYLNDPENEGCDYHSVLENGGFQAISKEGLKIDMKASPSKLDKFINDRLKFNYEGIVVYVGLNEDGDGIYVKAESPDGQTVVQYAQDNTRTKVRTVGGNAKTVIQYPQDND
ncbi:hypothetical protein [Ruminococcus albus]|uniref:Uncharacterized protein n=1 Tax=Ruminococcus albus (strain ATCC 27210 / DSM 20455 / JCM 14654 / NCDO 2250 / 7) TaxID=697329 RepID=E6UHV2_RUMA7|nr:hypothetical protein [Ruminococcus albus]ADU23239.1 hypothetical protein Rumal_2770 [Ruminococcus albus 7 = DSM 20455]